MAFPKLSNPSQVQPPRNYLVNAISRHILLNKPYPSKIPAIPSILKSLPAVMRDFGGKI